MRICRAIALATILLGPATAVARSANCPQFFMNGKLPAILNAKLGQRTTFLCNDAFAVLTSGMTHGAIWSAEHLTTNSLSDARGVPRRGKFHADRRLPLADQAQLSDYRRSGYDRGHMSPSGDMPSSRAQQQSFSLANIVPQAGPLNRGIWEGIESAVRDFAASEGELYVVTGAVFQGAEIESIGDNGVLVPTQTWKAIYDPKLEAAGAYICTNTNIPSCSTTSITQLSTFTGINPFPSLSDRVSMTAMQLPSPENSPYEHSLHHERKRNYRPSLLDQLLNQ